MCGIAGIHRRTEKPVPKLNNLADELLLAIESRGRHATGFLAMMDSGKVQLEKKPIPASKYILARPRVRRDTRTLLLHTRYATVGHKFDPRNAHPVAQGTIAAIHNGTIYNADAIFKKYGLPRLAEVDSEVIPALINHLGWDKIEKALALFRGGAAIAIVNTEAPDEVILTRLQSYPLVYGVTKNVVIWASTGEAIERAWQRTYGRRFPGKLIKMDEGQIARINGKVLLEALPFQPEPYERPAPKVRKPSNRRGRVSDGAYLRAARSAVRQSVPSGRPNYGMGFPIPQPGPGYVRDERGSIIPERYANASDVVTAAYEAAGAGRAPSEEELINCLIEDGLSYAEATSIVRAEPYTPWWDRHPEWLASLSEDTRAFYGVPAGTAAARALGGLDSL